VQASYDFEPTFRLAPSWRADHAPSGISAYIYLAFPNDPTLRILADRYAERLRETGLPCEAQKPGRFHCSLLYLDAATDQQLDDIFFHLALPLHLRLEVVRPERFGNYLTLVVNADPGLVRLQSDLRRHAEAYGCRVGEFSDPGVYSPHISIVEGVGDHLNMSMLGEVAPGMLPFMLPTSEIVIGRQDYEKVRTVRLPVATGDRPLIETGGAWVWPAGVKRETVSAETLRAVLRGETVLMPGTRRMLKLGTPLALRGGPGSGNFEHAGRPGEVGGSAPGEGGGINEPVTSSFTGGYKTGDADIVGLKAIMEAKWEPMSREDAMTHEVWVAPDGMAFNVETHGHEKTAQLVLMEYYGDVLRPEFEKQVFTEETADNLQDLRFRTGEDTSILLGDIEKLAEDGGYRWTPVEDVSGRWWQFGLNTPSDVAHGTVTFRTLDEAIKNGVGASGAFLAQQAIGRSGSTGEELFAAHGFMRVSRGGMGSASQQVGFLWDAKVTPTQAQRTFAVATAREALETSNGGVVWETVNAGGFPSGVVADQARGDDWRRFMQGISGDYARLEGRSVISRSMWPAWALALVARGGAGSGHFGHEGRPGERGGSAPGEGASAGVREFPDRLNVETFPLLLEKNKVLWDRYNEPGRTVVFRASSPDTADRIEREGLRRGPGWSGRPSSVYFFTNPEDALRFGVSYKVVQAPSKEPGNLAVIEFEISDELDAEVFSDDIGNGDFGVETAYRLEADVPSESIRAIHYFSADTPFPLPVGQRVGQVFSVSYKTTLLPSEESLTGWKEKRQPRHGYVPVILIDPGEKVERGGHGSGHYGHEGRPGERGGSTPGEGREDAIHAYADDRWAKDFDMQGSFLKATISRPSPLGAEFRQYREVTIRPSRRLGGYRLEFAAWAGIGRRYVSHRERQATIGAAKDAGEQWFSDWTTGATERSDIGVEKLIDAQLHLVADAVRGGPDRSDSVIVALEKLASALEQRQTELTIRSADMAAIMTSVAAAVVEAIEGHAGLSGNALAEAIRSIQPQESPDLGIMRAKIVALESRQEPAHDLVAAIIEAVRSLPQPVVQMPAVPITLTIKMPPSQSVYEFVRDDQGRAIRVYKEEQATEEPQWLIGGPEEPPA